MGTGWLREAWRQTQLCTHRRKPAQEEDSTADKTRAGGGPRGSSHHPLPLHTQGRGRRAAGCPGSNLRPAKTNVQEGPGRKRSPGPSCQTQRRGRSGSSPRRDFLGRAPFLGEPPEFGNWWEDRREGFSLPAPHVPLIEGKACPEAQPPLPSGVGELLANLRRPTWNSFYPWSSIHQQPKPRNKDIHGACWMPRRNPCQPCETKWNKA